MERLGGANSWVHIWARHHKPRGIKRLCFAFSFISMSGNSKVPDDPPLYYGPLPQRYGSIVSGQAEEPRPVVVLNDVRTFFCSHFGFAPDDFNGLTIPPKPEQTETPEGGETTEDHQIAKDLVNMRQSSPRSIHNNTSNRVSESPRISVDSRSQTFSLPPLEQRNQVTSTEFQGLPRISHLLQGAKKQRKGNS